MIDEADRMLDMGFIPDVRGIVHQTPHKRQRQTLFFSTTNEDVMRLAQSWTIDPEHIMSRPSESLPIPSSNVGWLALTKDWVLKNPRA